MEHQNRTRILLTPRTAVRLLVLLAFVSVAVFTLAFQQTPVLHESLHDLRHAAGFPCH